MHAIGTWFQAFQKSSECIYIYIRVRMKSSFKDGIESFGIRFERKKERGMAKEF